MVGAAVVLFLTLINATAGTPCELGKGPMAEWAKADLSKYPAPSNDLAKYPYELPIVFNVYNHKGSFFEWKLDDETVIYQLEQLRRAFRLCGIEPTVAEVHYLDGPKSLNDLDREPNGKLTFSDKERCLFNASFKPGMVNVYFVYESEAYNAQQGHGGTHAVSAKSFGLEYSQAEAEDRRYIGAAVITDTGRSLDTAVPHEVGHIVMNQGHVSSREGNLMSDERDRLYFKLTPAQCEAARASPFVVRRLEKGEKAIVEQAKAATRCEHCETQAAASLNDLCAGAENTELLKVAFCDKDRRFVNPYTVAHNPGLGNKRCRNYLANKARAQAEGSRSKAEPTVAEGALMYVYEDMRLSGGASSPSFYQNVAKILSSDVQAKADSYCRLIQQGP